MNRKENTPNQITQLKLRKEQKNFIYQHQHSDQNLFKVKTKISNFLCVACNHAVKYISEQYVLHYIPFIYCTNIVFV